MRRGLTGAIVHASKIVPLHKIPPEEVEAAEDLIFDRRARRATIRCRRSWRCSPTARPTAGVAKVRPDDGRGAAQAAHRRRRQAGARGRPRRRRCRRYPPLAIINDILLDGMKTVGELFGAGKMQLPFVLQSAETMKKAVAYLEPLMERVEGQEKGTIVLATVKGDVHDIGKNLVDIILTNNGYRVVNLGIKQPLTPSSKPPTEHKADAIGMSGLLVKSTVIMRENLEEMRRQGCDVPVLLGGAALTRAYVEDDCWKAYGEGPVAYARDAFDGLMLMEKAVGGAFAAYVAERVAKASPAQHARSRARWTTPTATRHRRPAPGRGRGDPAQAARAQPRRRGAAAAVLGCADHRAGAGQGAAALPQRPDALPIPLGLREAGPPAGRVPGLGAQGAAAGAGRAGGRGRARSKIFAPQAAYGYFKAAGEGNDDRPVRRGRQPRARALRAAAPGQGGRPVHRRLPARRRRARARRARACRWSPWASAPPRSRATGSPPTATRTMSGCTGSASSWPRRWPSTSTPDPRRARLRPPTTRATCASCSSRAIAARATASATRPARTSPTRRRCWSCWVRSASASSCRDEDQLWPEQSTSAIVLHHPQARYFNV